MRKAVWGCGTSSPRMASGAGLTGVPVLVSGNSHQLVEGLVLRCFFSPGAWSWLGAGRS